MPCSDSRDSYRTDPHDKEQAAKYEKFLCYVLTRWSSGDTLDQTLLDNLGLMSWWNDHQEEDRLRIEQEAKTRKEKQVRKNALSKLSAEEKAALGLNDGFRR